MIMDGCQSRSRTPTLHEKTCPQCGNVIEIFSVDSSVTCEKCGFIAYNDSLSCVQWCRYARQCVGDDMYFHMMRIAEEQKQRREAKKAKSPGFEITDD